MPTIIFNKKLLPLSLSSLISKTGDYAYEITFALIALELLSFNYLHIGIVYFFRFLPYLFTGPIGGWLADGRPYKTNMIFSDSLRCIVAATLYILYNFGLLEICTLIIGSMLMTIGRSLFQPSFRSYLPTILDEKELPAGNSLMQIIEDISSILGPIAFSLIVTFGDKSHIILLYMMGYFFSIIFLSTLQLNSPISKSHFSFSTVLNDTRIALKKMHVYNRNLLMVIGGTSICVLFTASLLRFVLPASIIEIYRDEALVGYLFSIMSAGTVVGGMCYTALIKNTTPVQLMNAWMVYGLLFMLVSISLKFSFISAVALILFLGFSGAIVDISIITNIQSLSTKDEIGKNYGIHSTIANACEAASGLISGTFTLFIGGAAFPIIALLIAAVAKYTNLKIKRFNHEKNKASKTGIFETTE
ncbi:MFS transporter [Pseudomonas cichorii]|uniref:MFS transporter n=1 Tax=Pseudomonas cichorii TaxID=36746 RepID=UPI001C8A072A|nr:MFS transporter [Pseudomonas cichorii]MBX8496734.1 MFS transporter [Pseudomonas cichorii]